MNAKISSEAMPWFSSSTLPRLVRAVGVGPSREQFLLVSHSSYDAESILIKIGRRLLPGAMAFTRMLSPSWKSSYAIWRVKCNVPALDAYTILSMGACNLHEEPAGQLLTA